MDAQPSVPERIAFECDESEANDLQTLVGKVNRAEWRGKSPGSVFVRDVSGKRLSDTGRWSVVVLLATLAPAQTHCAGVAIYDEGDFDVLNQH